MAAPPTTTMIAADGAEQSSSMPSDRRKPSRMAATGGIRVAEIAGRIDASSVVPTPTANAISTDRNDSTSCVSPLPKPPAFSTKLSSKATTRPPK